MERLLATVVVVAEARVQQVPGAAAQVLLGELGEPGAPEPQAGRAVKAPASMVVTGVPAPRLAVAAAAVRTARAGPVLLARSSLPIPWTFLRW